MRCGLGPGDSDQNRHDNQPDEVDTAFPGSHTCTALPFRSVQDGAQSRGGALRARAREPGATRSWARGSGSRRGPGPNEGPMRRSRSSPCDRAPTHDGRRNRGFSRRFLERRSDSERIWRSCLRAGFADVQRASRTAVSVLRQFARRNGPRSLRLMSPSAREDLWWFNLCSDGSSCRPPFRLRPPPLQQPTTGSTACC